MALRTRITYLEACAGVGMLGEGIRAALDWLGERARCVGYIERDSYAAATLVARMEDKALDRAPVWDDLTTFDGRAYRGKVDCFVAGFPCQPWSNAGKQLGTDDERWLWPDLFRIIVDVEPGIVFLENVPGLLSGHGLEYVLSDFASIGLDAEWCVIAAADASPPPDLATDSDAPAKVVEIIEATTGKVVDQIPVNDGPSHERYRVFILAYRHGDGFRLGEEPDQRAKRLRISPSRRRDALRRDRAVADAERSDVHEPNAGRRRRAATAAPESSGDVGYAKRDGRSAWEHWILPEATQSAGGRPENPESSGGELGHAEHGPSGNGAAGADASGVLANTERSRSQGLGPGEPQRGSELVARGGDWRVLAQPLFPPGPSDFDGWERVVADGSIDFRAPAVKPGVRVLVDGVALVVDQSRADQLRCAGNGVVPLQAALAFIELARRAGVIEWTG